MFLPRLTPGANKMFRDHVKFVRCQVKHYGVAVDNLRRVHRAGGWVNEEGFVDGEGKFSFLVF